MQQVVVVKAAILWLWFGAWGVLGAGLWGWGITTAVGLALKVGRLGERSLVGWISDALTTLEPTFLLVGLGIIAGNATLLIYLHYLVKRQGRTYRRDVDQLQRQIQEITLLQEAVSAIHDLRSGDALQSVVEIVTHVMGFRRAALYLCEHVLDPHPQIYSSCRVVNKGEGSAPIAIKDELLEVLLQLRDPLVLSGTAAASRPCDISSVSVIPERPTASKAACGSGTQIAVPLCSEQGTLGVLVADCHDRRADCQSDKELLSRLAKSAVVAIENVRLHRGIQRLANHDGLTNLYNYRYFQSHLRQCLAEAGETAPVSLFMIEIDQFKRYNDSFGHRQGDKALSSFARALENCTRDWGGVVARYGGDEFVVVLSGVGARAALQAAYHVHEQVHRQAGSALAEMDLPPVTMSLGVATYPQDARSADDLIEAADQAMYSVKDVGGNQVSAYSVFKQKQGGRESGLDRIGTQDRRYA
jgi:diguanylate cyclase (GGDEF)-like protein